MVTPVDVVDADLRRDVAEARERALTLRMRFIALVGIALLAMLVVAGREFGDPLTSLSQLPRIGGVAALGAFLALSYRPGFARRQVSWGLFAIAVVAALSAYGAVMRGSLTVVAMFDALLVVLSSATMPWGVWTQVANVSICAILFLGVAYTLGPFTPGDPNLPVFVDTWAAFIMSIIIAYNTRSSFDRSTEENLRLRAAEARIRSLAEGLDAKVRDRTAELEATLADQRSMTRAISHDLRQPLRHIDGFTRMLGEEGEQPSGSDRQTHITKVRMATARMDRMVDALLELSRVTGKSIEREPIDLSAMARDLGETLAGRDPDHVVELRVADGLRAVGDEGLVRNMLHELLDNAWKFSRHRNPAHVEVGRRGEAFFVRDDGSGFDMSHSSRMFGTFERLHHVDEFEGEGVGLAVAERVVRRHGGRIWAESKPGQGATFFFTLTAGAA